LYKLAMKTRHLNSVLYTRTRTRTHTHAHAHTHTHTHTHKSRRTSNAALIIIQTQVKGSRYNLTVSRIFSFDHICEKLPTWAKATILFVPAHR